MRLFQIHYNDGVFAEKLYFFNDANDQFINECLNRRIREYNKNPNKDYHITTDNIKETEPSLFG